MNVLRMCVAGALVAASGLAWSAPAAADSCPVMTFEYDPEQQALTLSPSSVTVAAGGCVTFNNQTPDFVRFAVDDTYRATVGPFTETSGDSNYQATDAGTTQPVTATGAAGQASGSIVIQGAAPPPSSAAPPPTTAPPPSTPASTAPAPSSARPAPKESTTRPAVVIPKASPPPVSPVPTKPAGSPPVVAGQTTPTPSPTGSRRPVVIAGPLQPPTGRGTGLPAAVAAIVIVGTAAALLRVLLSYPTSAVDSGRSVGATS